MKSITDVGLSFVGHLLREHDVHLASARQQRSGLLQHRFPMLGHALHPDRVLENAWHQAPGSGDNFLSTD